MLLRSSWEEEGTIIGLGGGLPQPLPPAYASTHASIVLNKMSTSRDPPLLSFSSAGTLGPHPLHTAEGRKKRGHRALLKTFNTVRRATSCCLHFPASPAVSCNCCFSSLSLQITHQQLHTALYKNIYYIFLKYEGESPKGL